MKTRFVATALAVSAFAVSGFGCQPAVVQPTELVVYFDTDIPLGPRDASMPLGEDQLRDLSFAVECVTEPGDPPCVLNGRGSQILDAFGMRYDRATMGTAPPFYFVFSRPTMGVPRTLRVTATARLGPSGSETISVTGQGTTVDGETRVMTLALRNECRLLTCPSAMQTCGSGGGCGSIEQPLQAWTGECADVRIPGFMGRPCTENTFGSIQP